MSFSDASIPDLLTNAETLYAGSRDDAEVAAALEPYGYTADDHDADLEAVAELRRLIGVQAAEYRDQYGATQEAAARATAVRALFVAHRRRTRRAHPRGTDGYAALRLGEPVPQARPDLLAAAERFWRTLAERPDLTTEARRLDAAVVAQAREALALAQAAVVAQARETGEAQDASEAVATAADALRADAAELAADAREALADRPQLLEKLGLTARS